MILPSILGLALAAPLPVRAQPEPLTVARCPYQPPRLPDDSDTALDATLLVQTDEGTGSAVLISPDGFALTAAHVVADAEEVEVIAHGGHRLRAHVVRVHTGQDAALLKVEAEGANTCLQPRMGEGTLGSDVFILGSPAGEELSFSVSKGIVSGYRTFGDARFVQLDASVNPGNSGGPAVDAEGSVIGIASWKVSHVSMEGLAFAVPADVALEALGVTIGESSSPDWADAKARIEPEPPTDEELGASSAAAPSPSPALDPTLVRRRRLRLGLVVGGSILLGTGITTIAITAGIHSARDRMTFRGWRALQGTNTTGWAFAISGAVAVVGGLLIPRRPRGRSSVALTIQPDLRGAGLRGRF